MKLFVVFIIPVIILAYARGCVLVKFGFYTNPERAMKFSRSEGNREVETNTHTNFRVIIRV